MDTLICPCFHLLPRETEWTKLMVEPRSIQNRSMKVGGVLRSEVPQYLGSSVAEFAPRIQTYAVLRPAACSPPPPPPPHLPDTLTSEQAEETYLEFLSTPGCDTLPRLI